ncbi:cytochrome P450 [Mycena rebaudengoi]|nr:cytochrome P450 [Mycena rebaudengoi]
MFSIPALAGLSLLSYGFLVVCRQLLLRPSPLPPGPRGFPLIGNIFDVPKYQEWLWFKESSRKFNSDIISLNLMGTRVIVLNSAAAATELLHNRSAIYSDRFSSTIYIHDLTHPHQRPAFRMINDLIGFTWNFTFMRYGNLWKEHRKAFVQEVQPSTAAFHHSMELDAARVLLQRLLDSPDKLEKHFRHMMGMTIMSMAYGIEVLPENDPYIASAEKGINAVASSGNSGAHLVESLPFLRYLPEFSPGAGFKRQAKEWYQTVSVMHEIPFQYVKDSVAAGTARSSIAARALEKLADSKDSVDKEQVLKHILGTCYAGVDTTVSALHTFILAMTLYPDIQRRAQEAIDKVVDAERLPAFSDNIPYVDAIVREVLRWRPVTPLGIAHAVTQDDVYNGYHIPSGSVVIANSWAILHDKAVYGPDTERFIPERWLKDGELNAKMKNPDAAFGFGRRICPGKDMAQWSMWITVASILASFSISKSVDEKGIGIEPSGEYTSGLLCAPLPFKCNIIPRSEATKTVLHSAAANRA